MESSVDTESRIHKKLPEAFLHTPLDELRPSIRLLKILPELSPEGLIQCELWHDNISATYTCLSYVWGSEDEQTPILVNEKVFICRRNLFDFLYVARQKYANTIQAFWIDAVCINQRSISERNHQVSQMGRIYSCASHVIAWLGCRAEIEQFCKIIGNLSPKHEGNFRIAYTLWSQVGSSRSEKWLAFLASPYWTRAWVTQEILLARSFRALAGDTELNKDDFKTIALILASLHGRGSPHSWLFEVYLREIAKGADFVHPGGRKHGRGGKIAHLLEGLKERECQITRDRIYSLLSVSSDGQKVTVDYGTSDEDFFADLVHALAESTCICSLQLLAEAMDYRLPIAEDVLHRLPLLEFYVSAAPTFKTESERLTSDAMNPSSARCKICRATCWINEKREHVFCQLEMCGYQLLGHVIARKDAVNKGPQRVEVQQPNGTAFQVTIADLRTHDPLSAPSSREGFVLCLSLDSLLLIRDCCNDPLFVSRYNVMEAKQDIGVPVPETWVHAPAGAIEAPSRTLRLKTCV